ncbi:MAG: ribosome maturation factor RimP [Candidatus Omnitrophota bacterium]|jgi:ribosome maturation factor RimP
MSTETLKLKIAEVVENTLVGTIFELDTVSLSVTNKSISISITLDRQTGGITLDECAQCNRDIGDGIEAAQLIDGAYLIDVSSPGIDKPLKSCSQFRRAIGKLIRLQHMGLEGKIQHVLCRISKAEEQRVQIEKNQSKEMVWVDIENIISAKLEIRI